MSLVLRGGAKWVKNNESVFFIEKNKIKGKRKEGIN